MIHWDSVTVQCVLSFRAPRLFSLAKNEAKRPPRFRSDRLRLFQPLTEPAAPLFAIRGIRRRIPHAGGGPRRIRHAPPVFRVHMPASYPAIDTVLAFHRSELLSMT